MDIRNVENVHYVLYCNWSVDQYVRVCKKSCKFSVFRCFLNKIFFCNFTLFDRILKNKWKNSKITYSFFYIVQYMEKLYKK